MSMCLNSSKGIFCHGCGKEVHKAKVETHSGYISVEFALAKRNMTGIHEQETCVPHYNLTVCGIECLKKVDWNKVYKEIVRVEKESMDYDYEGKNEKTGIE